MYTCNITVFDSCANVETFKHEYNLDVVNDLPTGIYDAVILSVAHDEFLSLDITS